MLKDLNLIELRDDYCSRATEYRNTVYKHFIFRPGEIPSPHEVLKQKLSVAQQLSKARVMKNEFLTSFKAIRNDVKAEIEHHNQISGVQVCELIRNDIRVEISQSDIGS